MSALECRVLQDGRIVIYHRTKNIERRFAPGEFKRITTYLLEYYREGTTELSPIGVLAYPSNSLEFHEPPKRIRENDEAVLDLWSHRTQLYMFVETNKLFEIQYLSLDHMEYWKSVGIDKFRTLVNQHVFNMNDFIGLLDKAIKAQMIGEAKYYYDKAREAFLNITKWLIENYCDPIQKYADSFGIYDLGIKCKFCPFQKMRPPGRREVCHYFLAATGAIDEKQLKEKMMRYYEACRGTYTDHFETVFGYKKDMEK